MAPSSPIAISRPAVLLLCEDPVAAALLRSLLRALPPPCPELLVPEPAFASLDALATRASVCFLEIGYAGLPLGALLARLRGSAPRLRLIGLLGDNARAGDRGELVRALRAGLEQVLMIEELSVTTLEAAMRGARTLDAPARPLELGAPQAIPEHGGWRIALAEQRASFDPATLRALGHPAQAAGSGLGDWKALIHPEDVDRLVREVQRVLEGEAAAAALSYRLHRTDGSWIPVSSDEISVELDRNGRPCAIVGRFCLEQEAEAAPATLPESLAEQCQTALARWRRERDGVFRLCWCNAAFGALDGAGMDSLQGRSAAELSPACDGFTLEDALERVHETGIAETRDALLLARTDPPEWRRYQLGKLSDDEVLLEVSELGELMQARHARRTQDELARYVMRSLPFTTSTGGSCSASRSRRGRSARRPERSRSARSASCWDRPPGRPACSRSRAR
jgi:PAS domain-containing protein